MQILPSISRLLRGDADAAEQHYTAIDSSDEKDSDLSQRAEYDAVVPSPKRPTIINKLFIFYLLLSTALIVFLSLRAFIPSTPSGLTKPAVWKQPCGTTAEEARAAGCHFDLISFAWLPDRCYDAELSEEFRNYTEWGYWLDADRQHPIALDKAMTGEYSGLYTEFEYHLRHCTFLWKKMHRAMMNGGKPTVDSVIAKYHHTQHCETMLLNQREVALDVLNSIILLKFPDCGIE